MVEVHRETTPEPQRRLTQHMTALGRQGDGSYPAAEQITTPMTMPRPFPSRAPRSTTPTSRHTLRPTSLQAPFQAPYYYQGPDGYTFTQQPWYAAGPVAPAVPSDRGQLRFVIHASSSTIRNSPPQMPRPPVLTRPPR